MQTLHSPSSEPYCVSWHTVILKELTGYFGGHWKLLVSPQWEGFTFFFFAADTQTWKLFNLPFWIMLDIHGQSFYLKKSLICWLFCIRYHNQPMSEVPPVECPAQLFILCPGSPLCLYSHLCGWLLGTMQGAEHAPGTALSARYAPITKGLTDSITLAPMAKLFSFVTVKHQAQV